MKRLSIPSLAAALLLLGPTAAAQAKPPPASSTSSPPASPPGPSPSADGAPSDPTRVLFEEGTADLAAGRFAEAAQKLRAAWQQKKSYDVAANLGAALLKLGQHVEAARFLARALEDYPTGAKPSGKRLIEEMLGDARAAVGEVRLTITGSAVAYEVRVDGVVIDRALVGASLFVEPGKRTIEASAKGYVAARQTVDAKKGQAAEVTLALVPEQVGGERSMLAPAIAFGVGGAGLVLGAITAGVAAAKTADLKKVCGDALVCPSSERGNLDGATTAAHVSTVGFVLAGLGAAAGVTLLLVPLGARPTSQARVLVGPGFLGVKGAF